MAEMSDAFRRSLLARMAEVEEAMAAELRRRGYTVTPPPDDSDRLAAEALAAGLTVGRYWHDPVTHEDTPLGWEEPADA